jgi:hypothetical protein
MARAAHYCSTVRKALKDNKDGTTTWEVKR